MLRIVRPEDDDGQPAPPEVHAEKEKGAPHGLLPAVEAESLSGTAGTGEGDGKGPQNREDPFLTTTNFTNFTN